MSKIFRDLPIADKIRRLLLFTSGAALLVASLAYMTMEWVSYRESLVKQLAVLSNFIGTNSTAAMFFDDRVVAGSLLESLQSKEDVIAAALYKPDWRLLAQYSRTKNAEPMTRPDWVNDLDKDFRESHFFSQTALELIAPIKFEGELIGFVYIHSTLDPLYDRLIRFALITFLLSIVILLGVFFFSRSLQRKISVPIERLMNGMLRVSESKDFTLRLEAGGKDEIGRMIAGFNGMIDQIQKRDDELEIVRRDLQRKVEEQTRDIRTAMKQAVKSKEVAEEASRSKSQFLATMSHEIRTPMNGVLGMAELLTHSSLNEQQHKFASTILHSGKILLGIINNILDFSRIEAGKLQLEKIDFNVGEVIEEVVDLLAESAHRKKLDLIAIIPPEYRYDASGDPARFRQILINLVGNAIKFTLRGEVTVRLMKPVEENGKIRLECEVSDTGIGISKEAQDRIFDSFIQADGSMARKHGGTGLGLAITQQLIGLMDGSIEVNSEKGAGSTFCFYTLFDHAEKAYTAPAKTWRGLQGLRVLVVDDQNTGRELLSQYFSAWGMDSISASNGRDALKIMAVAAVEGHPFELAVVDFEMPGMDGLELAKQFDDYLGEKRIPLVLLSSSSMEIEIPVDCGILRQLPRPIRQSTLYNTLLDMVSKKELDQPPQLYSLDSPVSDTLNIEVLLAEDNLVNQEVALSMLGMLECTVVVAENGNAAVKSHAEGNFDLILMDCQMPEMDGFEATKEIRAREKETGQHIPIIALTANAMEGDRDYCLSVGMDDYLSKPFGIKQLRVVMGRWIKKDENSTQGEIDGATSTEAADQPALCEDIVNLQVLDQLRALRKPGQASLLERMSVLFFDSTPKLIEQLRNAYDSGDQKAIRDHAHALKSSSANLGAVRFSRICGELENLARKNQALDSGTDPVIEIKQGYQQLTDAIKSRI